MNYEFEILKRVKNLFVWLFRRYKKGVIADGGSVRNDSLTTAYLKMCQQNRMSKSIQFAWMGETGAKFRTSGIYSYFTKLYSLIGSNHAVQTTTANQPYLCGNIAPNEKYGLKNPNGGSNYLTHPTILYDTNSAWSVTLVINQYSISTGQILIGSNLSGNNATFAMGWNVAYPYYRSASGAGAGFYQLELVTRSNIGKNLILTIIADGVGNLLFYYNSLLKHSVAINTSFQFNYLSYGAGHTGIFKGNIYAYIIRSQALTQSKITAEYNHLRALYPEIPSVQIGTQTWATSNLEMVSTPQGNLIANVTEAVNVELNNDTTFDDNTKWSTNQPANVVVSGGVCTITNTGLGSTIANLTVKTTKIGYWYKITFNIVSITSGTIVNYFENTTGLQNHTTAGIKVEYIKATTVNASRTLRTLTASTSAVIDDYSIQEIGWAGSQELYDGVYAQTTGTIEQKTYAAVKASAMWCYYNNDSAVGAVYGKLYNWFAAKLLQMDIDYYNAANPTAPWGWRVPTNTDFSTLQTTLGGAAISGNKLKVTGAVYWQTANGDNSSGFSAIGIGQRNGDSGVYGLLGSYCNLLSSIETGSTTNYYMYIRSDGAETAIGASLGKKHGNSIRLIKV